MFSIFKSASAEKEVVLQELTEGQLSQVAGGTARNDHDADDRKKWQKHHRHHHHHHHHHHLVTTTKPVITSTTPAPTTNTFRPHF